MSTKHLFNYMEAKGYDWNSAGGCSEPGYDDKPVILANWNNIPAKLFDMLENHGFSCEWEDEWIICDGCYKAFRCSPNSYRWEMFGYIGDGFAICGNCIEWDEYLAEIENNPCKAVTCSLFYKFENEITSRYELIKGEFENGFHQGMNDDPQNILKSLLSNDPNGRYIFVIDEQSQFYIGFAVYRKINCLLPVPKIPRDWNRDK